MDAYEQGRPSYPAAAVDYALDTLQLRAGHKRVIDLAAGTGKLTRSALCWRMQPSASCACIIQAALLLAVLSPMPMLSLQAPRRACKPGHHRSGAK